MELSVDELLELLSRVNLHTTVTRIEGSRTFFEGEATFDRIIDVDTAVGLTTMCLTETHIFIRGCLEGGVLREAHGTVTKTVAVQRRFDGKPPGKPVVTVTSWDFHKRTAATIQEA